MTGHGNPTVRLQQAATATEAVVVADAAGREVWGSHPLAAGRDAVCVDVRDGRFVGPGRGWSVLPPGTYTVTVAAAPGGPGVPAPARPPTSAGRTLEVTARLRIEARFWREEADWMPRDVAWHRDGAWRRHSGADPGIVPAAGADAAPGLHGTVARRCAHLFVDAAMHATVRARFSGPGAGSAAAWGLIARHYNDGNHLRLTLRREGAGLALCLERRAAAADPGFRQQVLAAAHVNSSAAPRGELCWHFNGTRHEVALDGVIQLCAADGYMGGVEIVGLFAEADPSASAPMWHSFAVDSSQWVPKHEVRRGAYAAVVRPGNIHRLHLSADPGRQPVRPDPGSNVFWESGLQVGHIGGSEVKFTQGAALDLLARGAVADLVRWRGPMPRFVEQDADLRGYARGSAVFYDDRMVVADWVAVRVRRSVGPDFDLLARALTAPARFAAGAERTFRPWQLPVGDAMATLAAAPCSELYPVALAFPLQVGATPWHLIAALGGLCNVDGAAPARAFGWQCPRRLTASHDLRVAPTVPGTEYGSGLHVPGSPPPTLPRPKRPPSTCATSSSSRRTSCRTAAAWCASMRGRNDRRRSWRWRVASTAASAPTGCWPRPVRCASPSTRGQFAGTGRCSWWKGWQRGRLPRLSAPRTAANWNRESTTAGRSGRPPPPPYWYSFAMT